VTSEIGGISEPPNVPD